MLDAFGGDFLEPVFYRAIEGGRYPNIEAAPDKGQAQRFPREFGQFHADAAEDALARFVKDVGASLQPGGSALFAVGERLQGLPGENATRLSHLGGKLVHTSIENVEEAAAVQSAIDAGTNG